MSNVLELAPVASALAVPAHVAIIMDGNGRWARRRGLPRIRGHRAGADRLRDIVKACPGLGVKYLTVFAFSTENWKRRPEEVDALMELFRRYIRSEANELMNEGVRVSFIGEREGLDPKVVEQMEWLEDKTKDGREFLLTVAINYGGRREIVRAAKKAAELAIGGRISVDGLTEEVFSNLVHTSSIPDPDLVIRTSGEARISNFLLWQCAYTEFEFVETLWPDYTPEEFAASLSRFAMRERRFGAASN